VQTFQEIARKLDQPKRMILFSVLGQQELVFALGLRITNGSGTAGLHAFDERLHSALHFLQLPL